MAISEAGEYTAVNAAGLLGANSVTDVTVPAHTVAIVWFHYYDATATHIINNSGSLPVLSGATCTAIAVQADGTHNATQAFWCTGGVVGAAKTLSYTVDVNDITLGIGISIVFLDGTETVDAIRANAVDADQNGASTSGAMTFVAGDWTMLGYTADNALDQTNGGANTTAITQYTPTDLGAAGVVYRTADGTISLPASANAFSGIVAMTVKASGAAGITTEYVAPVVLQGSVAMIGRRYV